MNAGLACMATDCTQSPTGVCIQCGRLHCARHGGQEAGYGDRCRECYALLLDGLVNSHYRAGKLPEVLHLLSNSASALRPPENDYYHGLALAAAGELDSALTRLESQLRGEESSAPIENSARQSAAAILSARAVSHLLAEDVLGAVEDLRRAVDLSPDGSPARGDLLAALAYRSAFEHLKAGRLPDALREWELVQRRYPRDLRVAHYLAVLYYRMASELEARKPSEAERYWRLAIAHWVVVLVNSHFWKQWAHQRSQAVGKIPEKVLSEVKRSTIDRLQTGFREYRGRYLEENRPKLAERHAEFDADFYRERHAARRMLEVMQQDNRSEGNPGFACGPLMLKHIRDMQGGTNLAEDLTALVQSNTKLNRYFSPLSRYYVMVKELGRYREAQPGLEAWLKHNSRDREAQELLVESLIKMGEELLEAKQPKGAVELLARAAKYNIDRQAVLPLLSKAAVGHTTAILQEEGSLYKKDSDREDQQILRKARNVIEPAITFLSRLQKDYRISDADFTAQLAQAYFRRGIICNNLNEYQHGLDDLKRALQIDPNHVHANENYVIVLFNLGIKHANDAINARNYNYNLNICDRLRNALAEMDEAIQLDPDNWHFRSERDKVQQIFRQLNCW